MKRIPLEIILLIAILLGVLGYVQAKKIADNPADDVQQTQSKSNEVRRFVNGSEEFQKLVEKDRQRAGQWDSVRKLHLKREPYCAWCGGTKYLQVHHIKPFALHPELHGSRAPGGELDDGIDGTGKDGNLITLCMIPKKEARTPDEADHHEAKGHNGHFQGGENLNVRNECNDHEKLLRKQGKWPLK